MPTFFEQRMAQLGVTDDKNTVQIINPEAEFPMPKANEIKIFQEDKHGNIEINYWNIEGEQIVFYNNNKTPMPRFYATRRLKEPKGSQKYDMPKGQGTFPWFHPELVRKYRESEKIDTLYLTEGVFKAWKGCDVGLHVVGLSSITHYRDHTGQLYSDVQRLIERCQIDNVVVLWDADCLNISRSGVQKREDLAKRPEGFFRQAKAIRNLVKKINFQKNRQAPDVYFMHIKDQAFAKKPKGLDDILIVAEEEDMLQAVVQDAKRIDKHGPYFYKVNITSTTERLYQHFGLHDINIFYKMHVDAIGENDFFFQGDHYYYNDNKNKLELLAPGWAKSLRWIADEFFMEVTEPSARGDRKVLKKYSKETLKDLFGKDFIKYLKHFAGFCNVPSHFNYEQVIERGNKQFYNRYFPFRHEVEQGDCDVIIDFFKHIFGESLATHEVTGEQIPNWELGLDYIQLLLTQPTQALPIICLYSKENATGKSTFGKLMQHIFSDNAIQIGNADLQSDFNETYADKLLAICEETLLERKKDAERIKALSTSSQLLVNPKGQRQYSIDFFCKFWFFSNNARMIYLTKHDERYWVMQVAQPKVKDPTLESRMYEQVPAFLNFLRNRKLKTKQESRMWFHTSLMRTNTFEEMVSVNEPADAAELREGIREMFFAMPDVDTIELTMKDIKNEFFTDKTSTRWLKEILTDYLEVDLLRNSRGQAVYKRGEYKRVTYNYEEQEFQTEQVKFKGRPYVFERTKFIEEGEIDVATSISDNEDMPF